MLRRPLREVAQSNGGHAKNGVRAGVDKLHERVLGLTSGRPSGFYGAILRRLDGLTGALDELPFASPGRRKPCLRRTNKLTDQIVSDIERWSRWGLQKDRLARRSGHERGPGILSGLRLRPVRA